MANVSNGQLLSLTASNSETTQVIYSFNAVDKSTNAFDIFVGDTERKQ